MACYRLLGPGDCLYRIEIDFSDDDWVSNGSVMMDLYKRYSEFMKNTFHLKLISNSGYDARYEAIDSDVVEIVNDSMCYWLDFRVVKSSVSDWDKYAIATSLWLAGLK